MTASKINEASRLAREFLRRVKIVENEIGDDTWIWRSKATGALRRASMELTRALAEMRKP